MEEMWVMLVWSDLKQSLKPFDYVWDVGEHLEKTWIGESFGPNIIIKLQDKLK